MTKTVLILGSSGKIGKHARDAFWNAGWEIRCFDRATDNLITSAKGCDVIVNGWNPAGYKDWATLIPQLTRDVINAAKASGATVIVPGNIYNFAEKPGVFDEHTPHAATTRKGKIRIQMEKDYKQAAADGVQTIVLRAGSFIDPDGDDDVMGLVHFRNITKRKLIHMGDPNIRHAYCYLPDWAKAAVSLAERRNKLEPFEDIPFEGHSFTVNELKSQLEKHSGDTIKLQAFPWALMRVLSPFWTLAYEMLEMKPSWLNSHSLSGTKLRRLLPEFKPTDLETVMMCSLPAEFDPNQSVPSRSVPVDA